MVPARHTLMALGNDQCYVVGGHATIQDFSLIEQLQKTIRAAGTSSVI